MRHYSGLIWKLRIAGVALPTTLAGLVVAGSGLHPGFRWRLVLIPVVLIAAAFLLWDRHIARHWEALRESHVETFGDLSAWRHYSKAKAKHQSEFKEKVVNTLVRFALSAILLSVAVVAFLLLGSGPK